MNDPAWQRAHELTKGYAPEFNVAAVHDLIVAAWRMGLDVVKAAPDSALFENYTRALNEAYRNCESLGDLQNGLRNYRNE